MESLANGSFPNLSGLVIGPKVTFSDKSTHWALFQNVSQAGQKVNDHFLILTVERSGEWFTLERYHDIQIDDFGPPQLADFMGKRVADVFPIQYDLRDALCSDSLNLLGFVRDAPIYRLTRKEIRFLAAVKGGNL